MTYDRILKRAELLVQYTLDQLHDERFGMFHRLEVIKNEIGPTSNTIMAPWDMDEDNPQQQQQQSESPVISNGRFIGLLRAHKTLSEALSLNAAHIRSINRQRASMIETLAALSRDPVQLQARILCIIVTTPHVYRRRATTDDGGNDWLAGCIAFYGHGGGWGGIVGVEDTPSSNTTTTTPSFSTVVALDYPTTLSHLGPKPSTATITASNTSINTPTTATFPPRDPPHASYAWCPVTKTYFPLADMSAATIVDRHDADGSFAAADARNVIPMSRRVAEAWRARMFFLMPVKGKGEGGEWSKQQARWSYQIVLAPAPMASSTQLHQGGEGGISRKELDGVVLKWKNGCRPRMELMHLRFVRDLLALRGEGGKQACLVGWDKARWLAREWRRRMVGWAGEGGRLLAREEVWPLCVQAGDPDLVREFGIAAESAVVRGKDARGVVPGGDECGGEVLLDMPED
ncbi:hypothetical protein SLS54_006021 [Diplodia seriata]